jgi:RNA polymerase sigma-70 factor (ECF subfamily)
MAGVMDQDGADVAAARRGDDGAFARLYDRHAALVLSVCRHFGSCGSEADDALQETFIRAFRMLDRLESATKLRSWLVSIAHRVCSERRRALRRRLTHEERAMTQLLASNHRVELDGQATLERREQFDRLEQALDALDDRQRLAIHLYYLESDPVAAARDALGISRSAFYKLLASARDQLAQLLREVQPS